MTAPAQMLHDLKDEYISRSSQSTFNEDPVSGNLIPTPSINSGTQPSKPPTGNKSPPEKQKLEDLANKSNDVLLKVKTVWPFTIFVNDIIIDAYKVTIIYRHFFFSERIHSIWIRDITDIFVETSLFFATVKIIDIGFVENVLRISYLKKQDALEARKIIQGLIIAHKQSVDLSNINPAQIKSQATELGKVKGIDDTYANLQLR